MPSSTSKKHTSAPFTGSALICCGNGRSRPASTRCSRCSPNRAPPVSATPFAWLHDRLEDPRKASAAPCAAVCGGDGQDNDDGPVDRISGPRVSSRSGAISSARGGAIRSIATSSCIGPRAGCTSWPGPRRRPTSPRDPLYLDTAPIRELSLSRHRPRFDADAPAGRRAHRSRPEQSPPRAPRPRPRLRRACARGHWPRRDLISELDAFQAAPTAISRRCCTTSSALWSPATSAQARAGELDFVDLLLRARDLLRPPARPPGVPARFTHLFVDEFQDTDPLQAEILLLLAADDPAEGDWRRITPVPGKLFIVGDPKQSIYRFRRADVETYQEVSDLLEGRGASARSCTRASARAGDPAGGERRVRAADDRRRATSRRSTSA